ncbi:hypothetical protein B0H11DRAFT_1918428 [Mycena galericulata]|nr:hypothetical protein B0H11DRAFT_1918428 [Mycena galericulata]
MRGTRGREAIHEKNAQATSCEAKFWMNTRSDSEREGKIHPEDIANSWRRPHADNYGVDRDELVTGAIEAAKGTEIVDSVETWLQGRLGLPIKKKSDPPWSNIPAAGKVTGGRRWPPVTLGGHWQMLMDSVWRGVPAGAKISTFTCARGYEQLAF